MSFVLWCVKTLKISKFSSISKFPKGFCAVGCKDFEIFKVPQCWDIVVIVLWYVQTLKFLLSGLGTLWCKNTLKISKFPVCGSHTEKVDYFWKKSYRDFSLYRRDCAFQ